MTEKVNKQMSGENFNEDSIEALLEQSFWTGRWAGEIIAQL